MHIHHHGHRHHHHRHAMRGGYAGRGGGPDWSGDEGFRGGRRRVFDGGELRLVLLALIGEAPRHGYDLIRAIETRTGGAYAPSPGVVYPTLTLLGDMEQIAEAPSEGSRKAFAITDEGRRVLTERAEEIAGLMARLDALGAMRERTEGASIRRAMHNLRNVLRHRFADEGIAPETLHAAVALIDEAAQRIERL